MVFRGLRYIEQQLGANCLLYEVRIPQERFIIARTCVMSVKRIIKALMPRSPPVICKGRAGGGCVNVAPCANAPTQTCCITPQHLLLFRTPRRTRMDMIRCDIRAGRICGCLFSRASKFSTSGVWIGHLTDLEDGLLSNRSGEGAEPRDEQAKFIVALWPTD